MAVGVLLAGRNDNCATEVLRGLHVAPWSGGAPNLVQLPLTREGQPMYEGDGGLK
jgi:hypothetical protein